MAKNRTKMQLLGVEHHIKCKEKWCLECCTGKSYTKLAQELFLTNKAESPCSDPFALRKETAPAFLERLKIHISTGYKSSCSHWPENVSYSFLETSSHIVLTSMKTGILYTLYSCRRQKNRLGRRAIPTCQNIKYGIVMDQFSKCSSSGHQDSKLWGTSLPASFYILHDLFTSFSSG